MLTVDLLFPDSPWGCALKIFASYCVTYLTSHFTWAHAVFPHRSNKTQALDQQESI